MKEVVKFFWERTQRAMAMDAIDRELGKKTHYWIEASEWTDAFKATLSNSQKRTFDYEWKKLDDYKEEWFNASDKKQKNMKNPLGVP